MVVIDEPLPLTKAGLARREQILGMARVSASRRRRRRRAAGAGGLLMLAALGLGTAHLCFRIEHNPNSVARQEGQPMAKAAADKRETRAMVKPPTKESPTAMPRPPAEHLPVRRLGDDELLTLLADAGQPAGLAYIEGEALLLFHEPVPQRSTRVTR